MLEKVCNIMLLGRRLPPLLWQRKKQSGAGPWHPTLDSKRVGPFVNACETAAREIGDPFIDFSENLTPGSHQRLMRKCSIKLNPNVRAKFPSVVNKCL